MPLNDDSFYENLQFVLVSTYSSTQTYNITPTHPPTPLTNMFIDTLARTTPTPRPHPAHTRLHPAYTPHTKCLGCGNRAKTRSSRSTARHRLVYKTRQMLTAYAHTLRKHVYRFRDSTTSRHGSTKCRGIRRREGIVEQVRRSQRRWNRPST